MNTADELVGVPMKKVKIELPTANMLAMRNDDCVFQVLDCLALRDICSLSRACKRLQALCASHFGRKYPVEAANVSIGVRSNGKRLEYDDYVRYFSQFIKELEIVYPTDICEDELDLSYLGHFINTKCQPNLHKIKFWNGFALRPSFCKDIESILQNVKVVQFYVTRQSGQQMTEAEFLRYCPNLTRLIIDGSLQVENVTAILRQEYGQLNSFYYLGGNAMNLDPAALKTFFQTNERIRCVAWTFYNCCSGDAIDRAVKSIQTLDCVANLQHLFLGIPNRLAEKFDQIRRVLDALCERKNFETLELNFVGEDGLNVLKTHVVQLAKWKQFTKIHLEYVQLTDALPVLQQLLHLRILVLWNVDIEESWTGWSNWNELAGIVDRTKNIALPQIEELQLYYYHTNGKTIPSCVMQVARHWPSLKRISVPAFGGGSHAMFVIGNLDRARQKLSGACELTIFTNHEGNATNLEHQLVKLKTVKFLRDYDDPIEPFRCIQRVDKNIN